MAVNASLLMAYFPIMLKVKGNEILFSANQKSRKRKRNGAYTKFWSAGQMKLVASIQQKREKVNAACNKQEKEERIY